MTKILFEDCQSYQSRQTDPNFLVDKSPHFDAGIAKEQFNFLLLLGGYTSTCYGDTVDR